MARRAIACGNPAAEAKTAAKAAAKPAADMGTKATARTPAKAGTARAASKATKADHADHANKAITADRAASGADQAMDLTKALTISARGMDVQGTRLRVIAENVANADTTGSTPGADAYRRKTITFENKMDSAVGAATVGVKKIAPDTSELPLRYEPSNPAANAQGYVKTSNVNTFIEVMDMREAERSYSANLNVMQATRSMLSRTIDMLK